MQDSLAKQPINGDFNTERGRQVTGLWSRGVWVYRDAVDDLWVTEDGAEWRRWWSEPDCRARPGSGLRRTGKIPGDGLTSTSPGGEPVGHGGELYSTHQDAGTDICALPKATGTHPAGVAERSTAGSALAVVGIVVVAKVCELANRVSATAMTTVASTRNFTVVMLPRSPDDSCSRTRASCYLQ